MTDFLCLPVDEVIGASMNSDRAADFLELSALFATDSSAPTSALANQAEIGAAEEYADLDEEMQAGDEEIVSCTVTRIEGRQRALGSSAYPFDLDFGGDVLTCNLTQGSVGHAAYISSLVLSNLRALSPILDSSRLHPNEEEVKRLRKYFQYFATAARAIVKSGVRRVGHAAALLSSMSSIPSLNLTPSMSFASWRNPRSRRQDFSAHRPIL